MFDDDDTISNGDGTISENFFINNDAADYFAKRQARPLPQTSSSLQHGNGTPEQHLLPKLGWFSGTPAILTVHAPQQRADVYGDEDGNLVRPQSEKRGSVRFSAVKEQEAMKIIERRARAMQNGSKTYPPKAVAAAPPNAKARPSSAASRNILDARASRTRIVKLKLTAETMARYRASMQQHAAASRNLLDLHIAIGTQYIRFLPQYTDIRYDDCTNLNVHLPVILQIGTYIVAPTGPELPSSQLPPSPMKKRKGRPQASPTKARERAKQPDKFNNKLEVWAHHTLPKKLKFGEGQPITPLELLAYDENEQNVEGVPGLEDTATWDVTAKHIRFLAPFQDVRTAAELRCLVRYCLLLAAANNYSNFAGTDIPKDFGFTRVLIDYCKRRWEDDRFRALKHTRVLPEDSDIWKGAVKLKVPKAEDAEQFSASESEGEDEIPAVKPEGWTQHLGKRKRTRQFVADKMLQEKIGYTRERATV
jgi:hypothetical protein